MNTFQEIKTVAAGTVLDDSALDMLLDTSVAKADVAKAVTTVNLEPVTLEEAKAMVEGYGNLLQSQEVFKSTRSRVPAFSYGTDCSLSAFSKAVVSKFVEAGLWPCDDQGKALNVVKARTSIAGKLFNRLYSSVSQRGIVSPVEVNGDTHYFIRLASKKVLDEVGAAYVLLNDVETSEEEIQKEVKGMTPLQRYKTLVEFSLKQETLASEETSDEEA